MTAQTNVNSTIFRFILLIIIFSGLASCHNKSFNNVGIYCSERYIYEISEKKRTRELCILDRSTNETTKYDKGNIAYGDMQAGPALLLGDDFAWIFSSVAQFAEWKPVCIFRGTRLITKYDNIFQAIEKEYVNLIKATKPSDLGLTKILLCVDNKYIYVIGDFAEHNFDPRMHARSISRFDGQQWQKYYECGESQFAKYMSIICDDFIIGTSNSIYCANKNELQNGLNAWLDGWDNDWINHANHTYYISATTNCRNRKNRLSCDLKILRINECKDNETDLKIDQIIIEDQFAQSDNIYWVIGEDRLYQLDYTDGANIKRHLTNKGIIGGITDNRLGALFYSATGDVYGICGDVTQYYGRYDCLIDFFKSH